MNFQSYVLYIFIYAEWTSSSAFCKYLSILNENPVFAMYCISIYSEWILSVEICACCISIYYKWTFSVCMLYINAFLMNIQCLWVVYLSIMNDYPVSAWCISTCSEWISNVCVLYIYLFILNEYSLTACCISTHICIQNEYFVCMLYIYLLWKNMRDVYLSILND
jgi:hypothetical protein